MLLAISSATAVIRTHLDLINYLKIKLKQVSLSGWTIHLSGFLSSRDEDWEQEQY